MIHFVKNIPITDNHSEELKEIIFGAGCFWGVEKRFWDIQGVYLTSVGYSGGNTKDPTYEDVCYKDTNHAEVVKIIYDPKSIELNTLLKIFWECHDPTQGMRQGNDVGTQYRSGIYIYSDEQLTQAQESRELFQAKLSEAGFGKITTEILKAPKFFFAEDYHQQYLHKNPGGYCGLGGTGVSCPIGTGV